MRASGCPTFWGMSQCVNHLQKSWTSRANLFELCVRYGMTPFPTSYGWYFSLSIQLSIYNTHFNKHIFLAVFANLRSVHESYVGYCNIAFHRIDTRKFLRHKHRNVKLHCVHVCSLPVNDASLVIRYDNQSWLSVS